MILQMRTYLIICYILFIILKCKFECAGNNRCQCIYDHPPDDIWYGRTNEYVHISRNRPPLVISNLYI